MYRAALGAVTLIAGAESTLFSIKTAGMAKGGSGMCCPGGRGIGPWRRAPIRGGGGVICRVAGEAAMAWKV